MSVKVVVLFVDDEVVNEGDNQGFEGELNWLHDSGVSPGNIYDIPEGVTGDPIEAIWIGEQISMFIQAHKDETGEEIVLTEEQTVHIINELSGNFWSADPQMSDYIGDILTEKGWLA